jgi:CRISPR system Cascade subunit CasE
MIYLSCLPLNVRSHQVRKELRDPYQMHRTLSRAFGDEPDEYQQARCLFRVDASPSGPGQFALVQSCAMPNWGFLAGLPNYLCDSAAVKEFDPAFVEGQRLAFRLRANPTVRRDGKRLGLFSDEERLQWLGRKAEANGFEVLTTVMQLEDTNRFDRTPGQTVSLSAVCFDGTLLVCDPDAFQSAVKGGIGSGKAFGFGLLSLARPR